MKTRLLYLAGVALFAASCVSPPPKPSVADESLPNLDRRQAMKAKPAISASERINTLSQARTNFPGLRVDFDERLATPKFVRDAQSSLTKVEQPPTSLAMLPRGAPTQTFAKPDKSDPDWSLKRFLNQNTGLFGYDSEILRTTKTTRESVSPRSGLRTVVWQQELEEIPVFEARLIANFARQDSLVSLSSGLVRNPAGVSRVDTIKIPARRAVALASSHIGEKNLRVSDFVAKGKPEGTEQRQKFSGPTIIDEAEAALVWLPIEGSTLRLCWRIVLMGKRSGKLYQVLIDAGTGELWVRHCWSGSAIPVPGKAATYLVFNQDSAAPLLPGWSTPLTNQPPAADQSEITLMAVSSIASPSGWVTTTSNLFGMTNTTFGNNVDAHLDWTNSYATYGAPVFPLRPTGVATNGRVEFLGNAFIANLNQVATNTANRNTAAINAFYWCNWMHDVLYDLGFDEEAGNFQYDNYERGTNAVGGDPVRMHVQTGAAFGLRGGGIFAASPIDGNPGQIWITLWGDTNPSRDGVFDATLLLHEYAHLLSTRLVGSGAGISAYQTLGLVEGWSDFYALALLSESDDDSHGAYPFMGYASYHFRGSAFDLNYYFGPRVYPYSIDMMKNPLTFAFLQADPAFDPYPNIPINPLYNPTNIALNPLPLNEAHAFGQVWGQALWDARAFLIQKHGFTNGNWLMLQLVTDGMKLSPANPTFLEARDATLLADRVRTGGQNSLELWTAFARRGMGYNATNAPSNFSTLDNEIPVRESFSIPPFVEITNGIYSTPALSPDGTVYVGSTNGWLYAVSPDSNSEFPGRIKWSFGGLTTNHAFNSSPALSPSGVIYTGCNDSNLYAVASSGGLIWRTNLGGKVLSSPALGSDGTVYVGSGNRLCAVNPAGKVKWVTSATGSNIFSSPAVAFNGTIYVGSMFASSNLYAFNPTNGAVLSGWPVTVAKGVYSSPAIGSDGTIYVGGLDAKVYAFSANGIARPGWPVITGGAIWSSPVIGSDGAVYIGSTDSNVYAINPSGTTNWIYKTRGAVKSTPALGRDGTVFVGSEDFNLHVINTDGTGRWVYPLGGPVASSPVIDLAGGLYVGSTGGNLYHLPTRTPFADGPWTMFRQNLRHTANAGTLILRPPLMTNEVLRIEVSGPTGAQCEVQMATNHPPTWSVLNSLTLTNGVGTIEINPTELQQYYRARFSN